jgi:two-component sensor histidine kinase
MELPFVRALLADARSGVWVGSENGVLRIVYNAEQQRYETDPTVPNLQGITVSDFYQDRHRRLWIATKGKGVACLDMDNPRQPLNWYTSTDGLCNDFTCRIEGSKNDQVLWISTHNGLSRFEVQSGLFHNFYEDSGFPGNEFNSAASAGFPDGTLFFGGVSGLISFHPDSIPASSFQYRTILSAAKLYDKESGVLSILDLSNPAGISLPPYPKYIEFQLGSTEYAEPNKVRFRYRLHGLSELWTYTSGEREVKFIRLSPGKYIFEVQAIPLDGHFGKPVLLPLFVATPFYESWWFGILLLLAILGIAYLAYRYRLRQLLHEQRIRRQIADDLHDDIGNKLNIISILAQKIANKNSENGSKTGDLNKLIEVSRNALRSLHTMLWSVDSEKDNLSSLISRMQDFAGDYLQPLGIRFRFEEQLATDRNIDLRARHHIIMIYQELLTNMVKYPHPALISIAIKLEQGTMYLHLINQHNPSTDPAFSAVSANRGLASIERRLSRIGGKFTWTETSETQQEIILVVPRIFKHV